MDPQEHNARSFTVMVSADNHTGTGFIVYTSRSATYILTNRYVVEHHTQLAFVTTDFGHQYPFRIFVEASGPDLCVLEVHGAIGPSAIFSTTQFPQVSSLVHHFGYAYGIPYFGRGHFVRRTRLPSFRPGQDRYSGPPVDFVDSFHMVPNNGCSGAAVLNENRNVIGVYMSGAEREYNIGSVCAVPAAVARRFLDRVGIPYNVSQDSDSIGISSSRGHSQDRRGILRGLFSGFSRSPPADSRGRTRSPTRSNSVSGASRLQRDVEARFGVSLHTSRAPPVSYNNYHGPGRSSSVRHERYAPSAPSYGGSSEVRGRTRSGSMSGSSRYNIIERAPSSGSRSSSRSRFDLFFH